MKAMMPIGVLFCLTLELVGTVLAISAPAGMFRRSAALPESKVLALVRRAEKTAEEDAPTGGVAGDVIEETVGNFEPSFSKNCHQPRPKALFCFSLVRTPPEPTVALLAKQLDVACDGWALFGDTDDPANNVTKAFAVMNFTGGPDCISDGCVPSEPTYNASRSIFKHLDDSGVLAEYAWLLQLEPDSFVRPSTLRQRFQALHANCVQGGYLASDNINEGYFNALHADVILGIKSLGWPAGSCDNVLSGHMMELSPCSDWLNISRMGALTDLKGNSLVAQQEDLASVFLTRPRQIICLNNTHLPHCVSEDFVVLHPVKDALQYSALMQAFP
jgi:hypothetical protein